MAIEKGFRRLRRIGLDEERVRVRQAHEEDMQLATHAADHADRFAEVDLSMTRRMGERHELLSRALASFPNIVRHDRDAAGKAVLVAQTLEDPLRGMALLARRLACRPSGSHR